MSNKPALFLGMRVKVKDERRAFRLVSPPIAMYVFHYLLLSLDSLFALIPADPGVKLRLAKDTLHAFLLGMMAQGSNEYVNVDIDDGDRLVKVRLRTF